MTKQQKRIEAIGGIDKGSARELTNALATFDGLLAACENADRTAYQRELEVLYRHLRNASPL